MEKAKLLYIAFKSLQFNDAFVICMFCRKILKKKSYIRP